MKKEERETRESAKLRRKTVEMLNKSPSAIKRMSSSDVRDLLEDLQIYQVELEKQNERLERVQRELEAARDRYHDLFDFAPVGYFTIDRKGIILEANLTGAAMLGVDRGSLINSPFYNFLTEDSEDTFYSHQEEVFETGTRQNCELKALKKGDIPFYVWLESTAVKDGADDFEQFRMVVSDIDEYKRAEEALRESEERYRTLFEDSREAKSLTQDRRIVEVNLRWLELHDFKDRDEVIGKDVLDFIHPDDRGILSQRRRKWPERMEAVYELRDLRKDGSVVDVEVYSSRISLGGKETILATIHDISERKELEAKLLEAHKMEALATLAGGIAHQFNNALTSITAHTDLLQMELNDDEKIMDYLASMKSSAHRMVLLTSQLLAYAREGKYNPQPMSLSNFVIGTLPLIQHTLDPSILVETDLPSDILEVEADQTQMQMVLSAIIANVNEAIDGEGRVRIITRNEEVDDGFAKYHPGLKPGSYVCLSIEDDGRGMDEDTRKRIFDPFFTTHFFGRGLGMAAVYGIVMSHDGWISVDSELGKGTVVRIYLPACASQWQAGLPAICPPVPVRQSAKSGGPGAGRRVETEEKVEEEVVPQPTVELFEGEGMILVIQDEENVMKIIRSTLEKLGYRVLEAKTGMEAVNLAETFEGDIHLAILDAMLPDMGGKAVYYLIKKARPNLKAIVCSGYTIDGPPKEILDAGAEAFIQKPFFISTLSRKVKEILEE